MIDYRDSEKAVNAFTARVARRLIAAGAPTHMIEDLKQELWVAWCLARDSYSDGYSVPFGAYLWGGMKRHINRWIEKNVQRRYTEVVARSLDEAFDEGRSSTNTTKLSDVVPSKDPTPVEIVEIENAWQHALTLLKPETRKFMELLRDPPDELIEQVRQIKARSDYARSQGVSIPHTNRVTTAMVFSLMNIRRADRTVISAEIQSVGKDMQRINS